MASQSPFGLPPLSSVLKPISPYLQRAHELRIQDPVMAYWCAYNAAQIGVSLKAKDPASRDVLFALLSTLERLKREIGPNDAVDIESVSSSYVENFALRNFALADNEDRAGSTTRSTAKKFLASAQFLEVLKIFPQTEVSELTQEKIKYAKWKAADIAKAFREGRKPTPGPVGSGFQEDVDTTPPASPKTVNAPSRPSEALFAPQPQTPQQFAGSNLDGGVYENDRTLRWGGQGDTTPGSWSTAATPGTGNDTPVEWQEQPSPTKGPNNQTFTSGSNGDSGEFMIMDQDPYYRDGTEVWRENEALADLSTMAQNGDSLKKSVHFTPSVIGGLSDSSMSSSAPSSTFHEQFPYPRSGGPRYSAESQWNGQADEIPSSALPPGFVPNSHEAYNAGATALAVPNHDPYYSAVLPPAPQLLPPNQRNIYAPSVASPMELTPTLLAKVQKHSRFAISALDYEDIDTARMELRNALVILGG
ncbi:hypothetical protein H0H81_006421 [Sphagnurus paluster]|uniref:DUF605-domain-containing protein n=1 Tax=Sphagnurus paluster TaxID=117069 RepID=A0A9P7KLZ2_9AGAR|nr:hypothetical protein H0H81_006421 [Sphagnurus paluster]